MILRSREASTQSSVLSPQSFFQRHPLHLLQRNPEHATHREPWRKRVGDADAGAAELEKVERGLAAGQDVAEFAREVFAIVRVQMERLEVIAEVHGAEGGRAAGELGQRHAELQRAENPV